MDSWMTGLLLSLVEILKASTPHSERKCNSKTEVRASKRKRLQATPLNSSVDCRAQNIQKFAPLAYDKADLGPLS